MTDAEHPASSGSRLVLLDGPGDADTGPPAIGAKAADLVRLVAAGLPVPRGFVLGTPVCAEYQAAGARLGGDVPELLARGITHLEQSTGRRFGAARRPLLVAVRSGAPVSMPGMLETVLNVGLCDSTLSGLLLATGDPAFVWDCYRRVIQSFAEVVEGLPPDRFEEAANAAVARHGALTLAELDVAGRRELVVQLKTLYHDLAGHPFPQDARQQLVSATEAVFRSWSSDRAVEYRRLQNLTQLAGTAVTVQAMVFGNTGVSSGSGVAFTRDPAIGSDELYVDFLLDAQGEDVVAGRRPVADPRPLIAAVPGLADELERVRRKLEHVFGDAQDFEFTVEDGQLWLLQTRTAKRTPLAALRIACDLVDEGLIDPATALERLSPYDVDQIRTTRLEPEPGTEPIGHATPASSGAASGQITLDVDAALQSAGAGRPGILVRETASTADVAALASSRGLLTATGARTSHAAVVARQLGIVCLINCPELTIDPAQRTLRLGEHALDEGDTITLDGASGAVYRGSLKPTEHRPAELINRVRSWRTPDPSSLPA